MRRLWACQSGATAIEYGLLAALLGVAVITGVRGLGAAMTAEWNRLSTATS